jgi:hypothetical protein
MKTSEIQLLIEKTKQIDFIAQGLNTHYSPNHIGQTTKEHCEKQFTILEFALNKNYDKLTAMIENEHVKEKDFLYTTVDDVSSVFNHLLTGLTDSDLKVLLATVATHDIGKVNPKWAKDKLNLDGVEFIAHDYDSRIILDNNPKILSEFNLNNSERNLVLDLVKYHSVPGQYFFGEGNLSAYQPIMNYARSINSENPLKLARIHGLIDVMSALNHGFVKPILASHQKMSDLISAVYNEGGSLGDAFKREAENATNDLKNIKEKYSLASNSIYRLIKLTGLNKDDANTIDEALSELDNSFILEFNTATSSETTWFGTYIANAFGGGLKRAFGNDATNDDLKEVVKTTVKVIAGASAYHGSFGSNSYALSSVTPGLMIVDGKKDLILEEVNQLTNLTDTVTQLSNQNKGLYARGNKDAIEISYKL